MLSLNVSPFSSVAVNVNDPVALTPERFMFTLKFPFPLPVSQMFHLEPKNPESSAEPNKIQVTTKTTVVSDGRAFAIGSPGIQFEQQKEKNNKT